MLELRSTFQLCDDNRDGQLSWSELESHLHEDHVHWLLYTLGIEFHDLAEVFHMLDMDGKDAVTIDEFVAGLKRVGGNARSVDVCAIRLQLKDIQEQMKVIRETSRNLKCSDVGAAIGV